MIPLYTDKNFNLAKPTDKLPFKCEYCGKIFYTLKKYIIYELKNKRGRIRFCSYSCCIKLRVGEPILKKCLICEKQIQIQPSQLKKSKSGNNFCSKSCAAIYNNNHKTHGIRRSKLEIWIEEKLTVLYPNLKIIYNNKEIINSELDIYIPSFKLAFELNGIFHYEPIFGADKLDKIQNNDEIKFQACLEKKLNLY